jgi:hypothetical protein
VVGFGVIFGYIGAEVKPKWHKKANPQTAKFVAAQAKPGNNRNRKQHNRLTRRLNDYAVMMNTKNSATQQRKDSGGYHRPGSNTK